MLNNLINFLNLISSKMMKKVPEDQDLIILGTRDSKYGGGYKPTGISVADFLSNIPTPTVPFGIWSLSDSAGEKTYYDTYEDAIPFFNVGNAITLETSTNLSVNLVLKNGININLNGNTLRVDDSAYITDNGIFVNTVIFNGTISLQTSSNYGLYVLNASSKISIPAVLDGTGNNFSNGVYSIGTVTDANVIANEGMFQGAKSAVFDNCKIKAFGPNRGNQDTVNGHALYLAGVASNMEVYSTVSLKYCARAHVAGARLNNSRLESTAHRSVFLNGGFVDACWMRAPNFTCKVESGGTLSNSYSESTAAAPIYCLNQEGAVSDCTFVAQTFNALYFVGIGTWYSNCTFISNLAATGGSFLSGSGVLFEDCRFICRWDNAAGHCANLPLVNTSFIDCKFTTRNVSALGINVGAVGIYLVDNKFKGPAGSLGYSASLINLALNTQDNRGNSIINY